MNAEWLATISVALDNYFREEYSLAAEGDEYYYNLSICITSRVSV